MSKLAARPLLCLLLLLLLALPTPDARKSKKAKRAAKRSSPTSDPSALLSEGRRAFEAEDFGGAVRAYTELREASRGSAGEALALLNLGNAYGRWGKAEQAAEALIAIGDAPAAEPKVLAMAGQRLQDSLGRSGATVPHFRRALAGEPSAVSFCQAAPLHRCDRSLQRGRRRWTATRCGWGWRWR